MDKTKRGFLTVAVLLLAGLTIYPLGETGSDTFNDGGLGSSDPYGFESGSVSDPVLNTEPEVTGHDWIWEVESIAFEYMALEVAVIGVSLYAIYWFTAGFATEDSPSTS